MKRLIILGLGITLVTFHPALAARDEGKCKEIGDEITKAKKDYEAAKPKGVDGLEGGADRNNEDMGQGKRNGGRGAGASAACVKRMTPINKKFKKLKDDAKTAECGKDKEEKDAEDGEQESQGAMDSCKAAEKANEGQKDKNGDNEKKMGDDKKKDEKGGGSPQMPQMPQIPEKKEKKEEKKEDPAVKEAERQARIAQCKVQVQMNLEVKKANCEKDIPFNPQYPVFDQKKKQDECKQNAIFASQAEMNMCEAKYPPTIPGANSTVSGGGGNTTPPTNTNTSTNTNTK